MINAGNRFFNPAVSSFEATWLDEALAHFAEDAVGRVSRGFGDLQTLTFNDVLPAGCSSSSVRATAPLGSAPGAAAAGAEGGACSAFGFSASSASIRFLSSRFAARSSSTARLSSTTSSSAAAGRGRKSPTQSNAAAALRVTGWRLVIDQCRNASAGSRRAARDAG